MNSQTTRFAMTTLPWAGADWTMLKFTFDATDQKDADDKAYGWGRYHGMIPSDVIARPATEKEMTFPTNNEFVTK